MPIVLSTRQTPLNTRHIRNGGATCINKVPERFKPELYLDAVSSGLPLEAVPEPLRREEICREAYRLNKKAAFYIPRELRMGALHKELSEKVPTSSKPESAPLEQVPLEPVTFNEPTEAFWLEFAKRFANEVKVNGRVGKVPKLHTIPNHLQDKVMTEAGFGFDAKGYLQLSEPAVDAASTEDNKWRNFVKAQSLVPGVGY